MWVNACGDNFILTYYWVIFENLFLCCYSSSFKTSNAGSRYGLQFFNSFPRNNLEPSSQTPLKNKDIPFEDLLYLFQNQHICRLFTAECPQVHVLYVLAYYIYVCPKSPSCSPLLFQMSRQHQPFPISSLGFPAVKRGTYPILVAVCVLFHLVQVTQALEHTESPHLSNHPEEDLTMEATNPSPYGLEIPRQERRLYRPRLSGREDSYSAQIIEYFESEKDYHDEDADEISNEVPVLPKRGLVPQLWPNYTGPPELPAEEESCNVAQLKCAYRDGCGLAIQNYMLACSALAEGKTTVCSTYCKHSLIALMSTPEGKRLMKVSWSDL